MCKKYGTLFREYDKKDLELLTKIKNQILFIMSTNSIQLYPKFDAMNHIYIFLILNITNIVYLRKKTFEPEENNNIINNDYVATIPIWMDDYNSFDNIGPIVNKCLRHAFHRILTIKMSE